MLEKMGLRTPMDVLLHLPRRYDSFSYTPREELKHLSSHQRIVLYGVLPEAIRFRRFGGASRVDFKFSSDTGLDFDVVAWNRTYLTTFLKAGEDYTISATFDEKKHCLNLLNAKKGRIPPEEALVPIYSLPVDFPDKDFRAIVRKAFRTVQGYIQDILPLYLRQKYRLLPKEEALWKCHFPSCPEDIRLGMRVLKYEEALLFCLKNRLVKDKNKAVVKGELPKLDYPRIRDFVHHLPYTLTEDQKQAVKEILADMNSDALMTRLLQGDVGSGKTLVASIALFAASTRASQGAIMAPTDTLARQHYKNLSALLEPYGLKVGLLVGSLNSKERENIKIDLALGDIDVIVGTHALFSSDISYKNLGLVIIDEQHKFGVAQRTTLANKGDQADVLLLSATPIPRTLSLTLFGELDVSSLSTFPFAKRQVETAIIPKKATLLNAPIKEELARGGRVYLVCPQIDYSGEKKDSSVLAIYDYFAKKYPGKVALLHGKMKDEEKIEAIASFTDGSRPILVSTSVIEVGIDVKDAHLMEIFDPSHFSLSSLHQLRGRVGRDGEKARCLLVYDGNDEEEIEKLNVIVQSEDGFHIAEEDLKRRGPGTFAGTRQSGMPNFAFANLVSDFAMFEYARIDAEEVLRRRNEKECAELIERIDVEKDIISLA